MKLSLLMIIKAVVCIVFGIAMLVVPAPLMAIYGMTLNPAGSLVTQFLGASFFLLATMLWLARNASRSEVALRAIVLAAFVGDTLGFVVALLGQLTGVANAVGWMIVALYFLLALGFGYFQLVKPADTSAKA